MTNSTKIYLAVIALLIVLVVVLDSSMPDRTDWTERYRADKTEPFDLKIFFEELKNSREWQSYNVLDSTYYQYAVATFSDSSPSTMLFLYVGNSFHMDKESEKILLDHVYHGSDVFISTNGFTNMELDTFGLNIGSTYFYNKTNVELSLNGTDDQLTIDKLTQASYLYAYNRNEPYISLGTVRIGDDNDNYLSNFVKIKHGEGHIYFHTSPIIFSNYYLLNGSRQMAEKALSVTDKNNLVFYRDTTLKSPSETHILKLIFSNPSLTWAWYTALGSLMIFMFFNAKRRQRIIPVITPPENTSVDFTKTISNLFYETRDHTYIIRKRITYFLEYIRSRYHLDTSDLDTAFIQQLCIKSGVSTETTERLIEEVRKLNKRVVNTESQVIHLDRLLEEFRKEEKKLIHK